MAKKVDMNEGEDNEMRRSEKVKPKSVKSLHKTNDQINQIIKLQVE